jgi:predicted RNase H-like HicB family nuclease
VLAIYAIFLFSVVHKSVIRGGFTAIVPSLPGCIREGETRDEALENIREAMELYLEPVEDDIAPIPGAEVIEIAI